MVRADGTPVYSASASFDPIILTLQPLFLHLLRLLYQDPRVEPPVVRVLAGHPHDARAADDAGRADVVVRRLRGQRGRRPAQAAVGGGHRVDLEVVTDLAGHVDDSRVGAVQRRAAGVVAAVVAKPGRGADRPVAPVAVGPGDVAVLAAARLLAHVHDHGCAVGPRRDVHYPGAAAVAPVDLVAARPAERTSAQLRAG